MSICAVVLGGEPSYSEQVAERLLRADYCIAADSGAAYALSVGRTPDILVGDLDSLASELVDCCVEHGTTIHRFPSHKDETDGELALIAAQEAGYDEIELYCSGGGRLDHWLANLFMAYEFFTGGMKITLVDDDYMGYYSDGFLEVTGQIGDTLSLIPLTPQVTGVTLEGLAYPLMEATLYMGVSRSVCNELTTERCVIRHAKGVLLALHYAKERI